MELNDILKRKLHIIDRDCESLLATEVQRIYSSINPPVSRNITPQLKAFEPTVIRSITKKHKLFIVEMCRILKESNQKIGKQQIDLINNIVEEKFEEEKYTKRIKTFLEGVEISFSRYGLTFDQKQYRTDLIKTCYLCSVKNHTRKLRADITAELHLLVLAQEGTPGIFSNINEVFELKPNFFGLGVNLNKLMERIRNKRT